MTTPVLFGTPTRRTLHLVDLENLLGEHREEELAAAALERYLEIARWQPDDQVIVAAHPQIIRQIGFSPPVPCNLHAVRGADAADVMLLSHAPAELVARQYQRLVIGSGDGIFTTRARAVRALGIGVLVVARSKCTARRLRKCRFPISRFDLPDDPPVPTVGAALVRRIA
jgi:uncharacterized LabA/DUF88 family protein